MLTEDHDDEHKENQQNPPDAPWYEKDRPWYQKDVERFKNKTIDAIAASVPGAIAWIFGRSNEDSSRDKPQKNEQTKDEPPKDEPASPPK